LIRRRQRRRRLGGGLLAFGIAGLVLLAASTVLVLGSLSAVDDAATGFERQRAELLAMLGPAADALDGAAASATNAGVSLSSSADAADRAGALTTRLASSFDALAALSSFDILGSRPFAGVAGQFEQVGADARALSTDLATTSAALRTNVADSAAVADDLRTLADRLESLEEGLNDPAGGSLGSAAAALTATRIVLLGLLLWFAVPAVASTWLGWRLWELASR
jgi:hypothetical protein